MKAIENPYTVRIKSHRNLIRAFIVSIAAFGCLDVKAALYEIRSSVVDGDVFSAAGNWRTSGGYNGQPPVALGDFWRLNTASTGNNARTLVDDYFTTALSTATGINMQGTTAYTINAATASNGFKLTGVVNSESSSVVQTLNTNIIFAGNITVGNTQNGSITLGGTLGEDVAGRKLTKSGTGILTLSGGAAAATYTGATTVTAGTLAVGANNSLAAGSAITLNASSTLDMKGFTAQAAALTFNSGANVSFNLASVGNGNPGDPALLQLTGLLNKSGTGTFSIALTGGTAGEQYKLISFTGTSFSAGDFTAVGTAGTFSIANNSLLFTVPSAIPEPSSYVTLAGLAGLVCAVTRRRRRHSGV
jgi:autotransporter-associated beta strand protein